MEPIFGNAIIKKYYKLGNYNAALLTDIESLPPIKYLFILAVSKDKDKDKDKESPLFYVTSEKSLMGREFAELTAKNHPEIDINKMDFDSPHLCFFSLTGLHVNLGQSSDWADIGKFTNKALSVAKEQLKIEGIPIEIPVKDELPIGYKVIFVFLALVVLLVLASLH